MTTIGSTKYAIQLSIWLVSAQGIKKLKYLWVECGKVLYSVRWTSSMVFIPQASEVLQALNSLSFTIFSALRHGLLWGCAYHRYQ
ncbi:hypothetical protein DUNSADRAFT_1406 [Dunaliella salina]|uniref:Encoded protein n=1 Tax=Dunaliella salina TaxID=3046 RepID=A0ABQ7GX39_DUNSA|nr:hypothetical protein DUNSADRAFT_1406 [Dunaliella salina]|eukprot:KAF5839179.1 hypothetical protein DUNSADRAFT_1406 [Dunaliella salina]